MPDFDGFGDETIAFLRDLSRNNTKAWFDANRDRYDAYYIAPAKEFVSAIGARLKKLAPSIHAEPRVNGSIFRINRNIRFSKDKTPYKPHLDLWFWEGARKGAVSGLFFRLMADSLILGAGAHAFTPEQLVRYRAALENPAKSAQLVQIEDALSAHDLELAAEHYKTVPRGIRIGENEQLARLARHNSLHSALRTPHPPSLGKPAFVADCLDIWRQFLPLHDWLMRM